MIQSKTLKLSLLAASLATSFSASAAILNGSFETGTLSNWNSSGAASVSAGQNYGSAGSVAPFAGNFAAKITTSGTNAADLASIMGISEATLEASNGGLNATNGAMIYQSTAANAGDSFTFKWNFVEQDYVPFDDWAFYGIQKNGGATLVSKFASLATVGPGQGSTVNGWESLTVNITEAGNYTFYFGIVNAADTLLDSDLWIDGISGTGTLSNNVPEPGALALVALALGGLGVSSRRNKRNA